MNSSPATTWPDFLERWGGLHNFLIAGEPTAAFRYDLPPLEKIVEEVRRDPASKFRSGVKQDAFDMTDISDQAASMPIADLLRRPFVLAHFFVTPNLTGAGKIFAGLEEQWVEPWRATLKAHGFTWAELFPILFVSGPNSASNYHMDASHQLAWQRYGTKHFHGLRDPDRWTTHEERGKCQLVGSVKPATIKPDDTYTIVQPPGTVLWNAITTPHWVETFDEPALTLTLVHRGLRLHGRLCPHDEEIFAYRAAQEAKGTATKSAGTY